MEVWVQWQARSDTLNKHEESSWGQCRGFSLNDRKGSHMRLHLVWGFRWNRLESPCFFPAHSPGEAWGLRLGRCAALARAPPSPLPLLCPRCGWMLLHRSSSLLVLALGSYWLLLATINSTTTVTSEYLGSPSKVESGVSISQLVWKKVLKLRHVDILTLRGATKHLWPEQPSRPLRG